MHNEHNPVAQIIYRMQALWQQKIKPDTALVRWLLKADEHRMYEGFCRLEASPYGSISELFMFFYTPFETAETFSKNIIENWLGEIKAEENQSIINRSGIDINSVNFEAFEKRLSISDSEGHYRLLIELMGIFRQLSSTSAVPLVLSIMPKTISSAPGLGQWIGRFATQDIPEGLRLLVFDHTERNYWGSIFEKYSHRSVTLHQNLNLDEAIRQIATGGDARSPDVQFRRCMYEMGDAAAKKQLTVLHNWGKKAIEVGTKSGQKILLATAYITYAGMLFTFKDHHTIQLLLGNDMRVSKQAIALGDEAAKSLLLQFYGYKAADYQHQKQTKLAVEWFMKQGREAKDFGLHTQSIAAYHKAFLMAQFKNKYEDQAMALTEALYNTPFLHPDEIRSSEYPYIVYEYTQLVKLRMENASEETGLQAEMKMIEVYGEDWKEMVRQMKLNFNIKEVEIKEAAARVS